MHAYILYIANQSRQKSFVDRQASSNLLENFCSLSTPLIFKRKYAHVHEQLSPIHTHETPSFTTLKLLGLQWWESSKQTAVAIASYMHHIYEDRWLPIIGKQLECRRELGNPRDRYATTVCKGNEIVGHMPF